MQGSELPTPTCLQEAEAHLRHFLHATPPVTGLPLLRALVRCVAELFPARYVLVSEKMGRASNSVRTLVFWQQNDFAPNFEYPLDDTPCEHVLAGQICYHPRGLQTLFPQDAGLARLNIESYLGAPLRASSGEIIGHLAVFDTAILTDPMRHIALIKTFAAYAELQLMSQRALASEMTVYAVEE